MLRPRICYRFVPSVCRLESRDVPATLVNPTTLTYQDFDGDDVRVVFSKPILTAGNVNTVFTFDSGNVNGSNSVKQQLLSISLAGLGAAAGTNITTSATRNPVNGGDGFAALGEIGATGIDLGQITLDGDLGRILAGDATTATAGLKGLSAQSMGRYDTLTGAPNLTSEVQGALNSLRLVTDLREATLFVMGGPNGKLGTVSIGGSMIGGAANSSGTIYASGEIGTARIGGSLIGAGGDFTAQLVSNGKFGSVSIGGDILAGSGNSSGLIIASGNLGQVAIGGDIVGSSGVTSGQVFANGNLGSITVGGSIIGGTNDSSGAILCFADIGTARIAGSVIGGSAPFTGQVAAGNGRISSVTIGGSVTGGTGDNSGRLFADGDIGMVKIGGNLVGGDGGSAGAVLSDARIGSVTVLRSVTRAGSIRANKDIGVVLIQGSLLGRSSTEPAVISAVGHPAPTATSDLAIGKLTVFGRVEFADILAGVDRDGNAVNADAQIGPVTVGHDWIASSIAAGAVAGGDGFFGTDDDGKITGGGVKDETTVFSRIASITIGGQVIGSFGVENHGFVAEQIGSLRIGGTVIPLTFGRDNILLNFLTDNIRLREI